MLETRAVHKHLSEFAVKGANANWKPVQFTFKISSFFNHYYF